MTGECNGVSGKDGNEGRNCDENYNERRSIYWWL